MLGFSQLQEVGWCGFEPPLFNPLQIQRGSGFEKGLYSCRSLQKKKKKVRRKPLPQLQPSLSVV
jgi:hypothetical protein